MNVLIVYYSTYGNVYRMATLVAEVQEIPGAQPVVRTVPELIPQSVIDAREDMKAGRRCSRTCRWSPGGFPRRRCLCFRDADAFRQRLGTTQESN